MLVPIIFRIVGLLALVWLESQPARAAVSTRLSGSEIYRQLCAECHGPTGEGVKGKYPEGLHGDWSVEKLTRYIDKSMPEGAPEKCVGEDAKAVASYIYDAFYSRAAWAKLHPARVELVRLTNRQYGLTVADLFKRLGNADPPVGPERGLRAKYFNSRNFGKDKEVFERIDREVRFEFGTNAPAGVTTTTNGFAMQWRGSLLADDTGEHEIILRTPNGARLWLNDEETPLIDAGVASGQLEEHKAKLRLLGGRAYPLRLEFFRAPKDKTAAVGLQWKPPQGPLETIPARNLSPTNSTRSFVITTPFPPDDSSVGYERGVSVSKAWDEAATQAAIEVAVFVVKNLDRLSRSKPGDADRAKKVESFCLEFVTAAFRRPLTDDQKRLYVTAPLKGSPKSADAVTRVVLLTLKSPHFLYLGLDGAKPDDYAVASRLAFGLWDSLPDKELSKLAESGALHTREQVTAQARRMLTDPRAHAKVRYFFHHWLQLSHAEVLTKDPALFPGFTPELIADLRTSLDLFLEEAVWNGTSDYRRLLLAEHLHLNGRLAKFYGVETTATNDFVKIALDPKQRAGVVTHPYLLAAFSYPKTSSPIHRGVFLARNIVGRALRPPPTAVVFKDADFAPNLTMREKITELTRSRDCQGCHAVINPLGFSLEQFDAVGRFRTREQDRAIDVVSDYLTDDGEKVRFTGPRDVAEFAVRSESAQQAFVEQLFNQIVKQPMLAYGADSMTRLHQSFAASGFNMQKLLVEIATLSALHGRETSTEKKP